MRSNAINSVIALFLLPTRYMPRHIGGERSSPDNLHDLNRIVIIGNDKNVGALPPIVAGHGMCGPPERGSE
jgi:hypothetical protein